MTPATEFLLCTYKHADYDQTGNASAPACDSAKVRRTNGDKDANEQGNHAQRSSLGGPCIELYQTNRFVPFEQFFLAIPPSCCQLKHRIIRINRSGVPRALCLRVSPGPNPDKDGFPQQEGDQADN